MPDEDSSFLASVRVCVNGDSTDGPAARTVIYLHDHDQTPRPVEYKSTIGMGVYHPALRSPSH